MVSSRTRSAERTRVTAAQALRFRVRRHGLDQRTSNRNLRKVVGTAGLQAQVASAAEAQLWARVHGLSATYLAKALWRDKTLLKTLWRGALHYLPTEELPVLLGSRNRREGDRERFWTESVTGITRADVERVTDLVNKVLAGKQMTRRELISALTKRAHKPELKAWLQNQWSDILHPAAARGVLCYGPSDTREVVFVRPEDWLGKKVALLDPSEAREEMLRRYLRLYGPSNRLEFAAWMRTDPVNMKSTWDAVVGEMEEVDYEGKKGWVLKTDLEELIAATLVEPARLIPMFDPYLAVRDRTPLTQSKLEHKKVYREAGWISAAVLVSGRVEGTWTMERKAKVMKVAVNPFRALPSGSEPR